MTVELIDTNEEGATTVAVQQLGNDRTIAYTLIISSGSRSFAAASEGQ